MFRKIIVATDLSDASNALINCLGSLQAYGTEECLLLQCLSLQAAASLALAYDTATPGNSLREQQAILEKQGYKVESRVVTGVAKQMLHHIAVEEDFSIIVVGAQEHSLTKEIFFGGLAYEIIHNSQKPVLLIRLAESDKDGLSCIKSIGCDIGNHVLFPTDFSEGSDYAFEYLEKMVTDGVKKVILLHVQDKQRISPYLEDSIDEFNRIDGERLDDLKKMLKSKANVEVETVLRYGSPTGEILNLIREQNVQLVVMGSQGRGRIQEIFLGSVSHNVARHSPASVLLIPMKSVNQ